MAGFFFLPTFATVSSCIPLEKLTPTYNNAVQQIKEAILQSQLRAAKAVNQEQLALYYGIGKYISENSREGFWGKGALETISEQLRKELPGLRGFSVRNLKNMRTFYEEWRFLETNSAVGTAGIVTSDNSAVGTAKLENIDNQISVVSRLPFIPTTDFPVANRKYRLTR